MRNCPIALVAHNSTTILNDPGANAATFAPAALNYTLSGMPSTAKSQLFEKSNGTFELVLWNNTSNWNMAAGTPITVPPTNVTVNFSASQPVVNTYDPTVQSSVIAQATNTMSVVIALRDYPMIVEIPAAFPVNTLLPSIMGTPSSRPDAHCRQWELV